MNTKQLLKAYLYGSAGVNAVLWVCLVFILHEYYPSNHTGYQLWWIWAIVIGTSGSIAAPQCVRRNVGWAMLGMWAVLCLSLIVLDRFNMLVQYDIWIRRGMPAWGECHW